VDPEIWLWRAFGEMNVRFIKEEMKFLLADPVALKLDDGREWRSHLKNLYLCRVGSEPMALPTTGRSRRDPPHRPRWQGCRGAERNTVSFRRAVMCPYRKAQNGNPGFCQANYSFEEVSKSELSKRSQRFCAGLLHLCPVHLSRGFGWTARSTGYRKCVPSRPWKHVAVFLFRQYFRPVEAGTGVLSLFVKSHTVSRMAITPSLISKAFALQRPSARFKSSRFAIP
jgi:hypothetical protein